jgi:hypothetical protein
METAVGVRSSELRVADLAFEVYDRPVHPEWFSSRAHQRIARTPWTADLHLIPGGHVVIWTSGAARVTEILGALDPALPETGQLYRSRVRHEKSTRAPLGPGITYQACFESEHVDSCVFAHLYDELTLDAQRTGLFHRLGSGNRLSPPALGHLRFECDRRSLSVQATHMLPHDLAIVRVQSLFEIAPNR